MLRYFPSHLSKPKFTRTNYFQERSGPVQFEKDTTDPFGIDSMIAEASAGAGQKRYGKQEAGESSRGSKRARVDDD